MSPGTASRLIVVVLGCAVGVGAFAPVGAVAACVGPQLLMGAQPPMDGPGASVPDVGVGDAIDVQGEWFRNGCADTGPSGPGPGCAGPRSTEQAETPMDAVDLVLVQGDAEWTLATADAGSSADRYAVGWTARIPEDARPGPATLRAATAQITIEITD